MQGKRRGAYSEKAALQCFDASAARGLQRRVDHAPLCISKCVSSGLELDWNQNRLSKPRNLLPNCWQDGGADFLGIGAEDPVQRTIVSGWLGGRRSTKAEIRLCGESRRGFRKGVPFPRVFAVTLVAPSPILPWLCSLSTSLCVSDWIVWAGKSDPQIHPTKSLIHQVRVERDKKQGMGS